MKHIFIKSVNNQGSFVIPFVPILTDTMGIRRAQWMDYIKYRIYIYTCYMDENNKEKDTNR